MRLSSKTDTTTPRLISIPLLIHFVCLQFTDWPRRHFRVLSLTNMMDLKTLAAEVHNSKLERPKYDDVETQYCLWVAASSKKGQCTSSVCFTVFV